MPGYAIHLTACGEKILMAARENQSRDVRSFILGVEAPDILKKHVKVCGGIDEAEAKYESLRTSNMPEYRELKDRIQQKERRGSTEGLHYGLSSSTNVRAFWNGLTESQRSNPFYKGYAWHLLTDAIIYGRLDIDSKFQKVLESYTGDMSQEELRKCEVQKLHADWDKTNALVRDNYPDFFLPDEVEELGVVQYIDDGELAYVDWTVLKSTLEYLRTFSPMEDDMDVIIETVLNNI